MHVTFYIGYTFPLSTRIASVHWVYKMFTPLACYNLDVHELILIIFGRNTL